MQRFRNLALWDPMEPIFLLTPRAPTLHWQVPVFLTTSIFSLPPSYIFLGTGLPSPPPIASITLFEPNTFFLLAAGTQNERRILQEEGGAWCNKVEQFWLKNNQEEEELPSTELCNEMNRFFHHFWNYDDWDTVPEKRLQWFNPDRMTLVDQRRWRLEVMSILNTWRNPDEEVADQMLRNLSTIPSKRIILSPLPGPGSRNLLQALADLLSRFPLFKSILVLASRVI